MSEPIDEDADLRATRCARAGALRELQDVLTWPQPSRDALSRSLVQRSNIEPLARLIAMADTDEIVRLRLLRALRDLGVGIVARHRLLGRAFALVARSG